MITTPCKLSAIKSIKRRRRDTSTSGEEGKFTRGNMCKGRIEDKEKENNKENKGRSTLEQSKDQ